MTNAERQAAYRGREKGWRVSLESRLRAVEDRMERWERAKPGWNNLVETGPDPVMEALKRQVSEMEGVSEPVEMDGERAVSSIPDQGNRFCETDATLFPDVPHPDRE